MKKLLSIVVVLSLLSVFGGTLYFLYAKSEEPPMVFATQSAEIATIIKKTVATGSVVPRKEVEIKPQVSGIIDTIHVEAGDIVARGDLIAKIRLIPNMVSLNNAENRLNLGRIAVDSAKRDLDRNRQLAREGTISESSFQQFEMAFASAEEELAAAINNLQLLREGTTKATASASTTLVRSTIDGMVLEVPLEAGNSVIESNTFNDGTTIATIADMEDMIFLGQVDESEVGKLLPGMDLLLTIGALEEQRFDALLEHISPKGVEEEGAIQFPIRAALRLKEGVFIRANYSANADIVLERRDDVLAINESLLQWEQETPFVEIEVGEQNFERREIETGLSDGIIVEVLGGVSAEDAIKDPSSGEVG